jgi:HK97 family phage prohead protease
METEISGYASLFWTRDLNDDVTAAGAFGASLAKTGAGGVKMLCQHDADRPIGVWDEAFEDGRGLFVRGRILDATPEGRLCAALVRAGAMDGLSIGFKTTKARPDETGRLRVLTELDLWEVSIVTFPMLPGARIDTVSLLPLREKVAAYAAG